MLRIARLAHGVPEVAAAIVDVQRAAYAVEAEIIGYDRMPPLRETASDVVSLDLTMLGAVDGELVGILGYRRNDDGVDIDRLAVDPGSFRRGIGRALLTELHECEHGAIRFDVSTGAANMPARALYAALGYELRRERVLDGVRVAFLRRVSITGP